MRKLENHQKDSEEGVTLIFFTICLSVVIGFTGLVVDGGRLWVERRNLVTAADAGALAGAHETQSGSDGCGEAEDYVESNAVPGVVVSCVISNSSTGGTIEVTATSDVNLTFMRLFGQTTTEVAATTKVNWEQSLASGLRPFGVCASGAGGAINSWLSNPTYTVTVRIYFQQTVTACTSGGSAPGNWGAVDFDGGSNSNNEINDWILNGYSGTINTTSNTSSCTIDPFACYEGNPGVFSGSNRNALNWLQNSNLRFAFPIFSTGSGNGANFQMKMLAVAEARLVGHRVNGNQSGRYIDLEIQADSLLQYGDTSPNPEIAICGNNRFDAC